MRFTTLILILTLTACATPSTPKDNNAALIEGQGILIFSTIEEERDRHYVPIPLRAVNAVLNIGLSEMTRYYNIHFSQFHPRAEQMYEDRNLSPSLFHVQHSFQSRELARTKRWHIVPLEAGDYIINQMEYRDHGDNRRSVFSSGSLHFNVKANQAVYLGDFVLGLDQKSPNRILIEPIPRLVGYSVDESAARLQLANYPQFPTAMNTAEFKLSSFTRIQN